MESSSKRVLFSMRSVSQQFMMIIIVTERSSLAKSYHDCGKRNGDDNL